MIFSSVAINSVWNDIDVCFSATDVDGSVKVTGHLCFKNRKNLRLLDILACDSANKPSVQNPTKSLFAQCSIDVNSAVIFTALSE